MAREDFINESIELYLNYEYLPVEQYSKIVLAANGVYQSLADTLIFGGLNYINSPYIVTYPIPLCLEEVHTGNSIKTKFSFAKRFFPGIRIEDSETVNIILPQWSAVLILSGLVLSFGMDKYKDYLDIRLKQLEVNEKVREEVKTQSEKLDSVKSNLNSPASYVIQQNIYQFQSQIHQSNIKQVQINEQTIHQKQ